MCDLDGLVDEVLVVGQSGEFDFVDVAPVGIRVPGVIEGNLAPLGVGDLDLFPNGNPDYTLNR